MLSWCILEYERQMVASGELSHDMNVVKWSIDYLLKAHSEPYLHYGEILCS